MGPSREEHAFQQLDRYNTSRWVEMHNGQRKKSTTASSFSPSNEHHSFCHGLHACSRRFYASNGFKIMLAHIALDYD
ncbi:hypothetical protein MCOR25_005055 [Pyricularia grisea]|nr:hypothetical protein MCOR25_005055 [Pyricularia grisea]